MSSFKQEKQVVRHLFDAMKNKTSEELMEVFDAHLSDDYQCFAVYPFNEIEGKQELVDKIWGPLYQSFRHLQRREDIFMAGENEIEQENWVMSMGHFMGLFDEDWLGIKATKKVAMLRYAEFNCVKDGKIIQSGLFFDIIGLMQFVGLRPLPPETGEYFVYPGPIHHNGLLTQEHKPEEAQKTLALVNEMIADLNTFNKTANDHYSPDILAKTWHEDMSWYGPGGIGGTFTILRYQQQHSYPFRQNLKDKRYNGHKCRFAEGEFACFFGWPNLTNTPTGGFLGLPGCNNPADMRVVDVYYRDGDKLKENWVLIDLPYWLKQQGLDVIERTRQICNP